MAVGDEACKTDALSVDANSECGDFGIAVIVTPAAAAAPSVDIGGVIFCMLGVHAWRTRIGTKLSVTSVR